MVNWRGRERYTSGAGLRLMGWRRRAERGEHFGWRRWRCPARRPGPLLILSSARASGRVSKDRPSGGNASLDTRLTPLLGMRGKRTGPTAGAPSLSVPID